MFGSASTAESWSWAQNLFFWQPFVKVVKNKVAPPFKIAEFNIVFGEGADKLNALINVASDMGIITRAGSWYSYLGEQLGQGPANVAVHLQEHPEVLDAIQSDVYKQIGQSDGE